MSAGKTSRFWSVSTLLRSLVVRSSLIQPYILQLGISPSIFYFFVVRSKFHFVTFGRAVELRSWLSGLFRQEKYVVRISASDLTK